MLYCDTVDVSLHALHAHASWCSCAGKHAKKPSIMPISRGMQAPHAHSAAMLVVHEPTMYIHPAAQG